MISLTWPTAITHIRYLEITRKQLQDDLRAANAKTTRLQRVNEALALGAAEHDCAAVVAAFRGAPAAATPSTVSTVAAPSAVISSVAVAAPSTAVSTITAPSAAVSTVATPVAVSEVPL